MRKYDKAENMTYINYIKEKECFMKGRLVIDGNAFYEIDEECMRKKKKEEVNEKQNKQNSEKKNKK